jgi:starch phosphorylase
MPPRTFIFGGKAAPGYFLAKLIIKLITAVGERSTATRGQPRPASRSCSCPTSTSRTASCIYPAANLSEQISTGRQGGVRHRQHEVHDERGADHRHARRRQHRDPRGGRRGQLLPVRTDDAGGQALRVRAATARERSCRPTTEVREVFDLIASGFFSHGRPRGVPPADREPARSRRVPGAGRLPRPTVDCQDQRCPRPIEDPERWSRMSILNVARSGAVLFRPGHPRVLRRDLEGEAGAH